MATKTKRRGSSHSSSSSSSPSTPVHEEDLAKSSTWHSDDDTPPSPPPFPAKWKGKGREVPADHGEESVEMEIGYPPASVEDAESRRIMNNLKKWDAKERHQRKLTRDATTNHARSQSQSVVDDVSHRASILWKNIGGRTKTKRPSGSDHQVLQDADLEGEPEDDEEVRLSTFVSSPIGSPVESPTPTQSFQNLSNESHIPTSGDPFADPDDNSSSRHEIPHDGIAPSDGVIMDPVPTPPASSADIHHPHLSSSSNSTTPMSQQPGPPLPLRLPPPKTPPPASTPSPQNTVVDNPEQEVEFDEPGKGKWWTEWLCGCSEGADRGGDNQAGKTNPFE